MSGLEVNKILASIILAILVVIIIGHLGDIIIDVKNDEMVETAYKIDITENNWVIKNSKIYQQNNYINENKTILKTNFNSERIQSLYSNLSSLGFYELYELRKNYKKLNYSITEINLQIFVLSLLVSFKNIPCSGGIVSLPSKI